MRESNSLERGCNAPLDQSANLSRFSRHAPHPLKLLIIHQSVYEPIRYDLARYMTLALAEDHLNDGYVLNCVDG
jgi:hypothetical protein